MRTTPIRTVKDSRGTVMLEFMLSIMVLLVIWSVMCNCALLLRERLAVASALREAGREAAVNGNFFTGVERGRQILEQAGIPNGRAQIEVYQAADNLIAAEVTCQSPVILPLISSLMGGGWASSVTFSDTKYFRYEAIPGD